MKKQTGGGLPDVIAPWREAAAGFRTDEETRRREADFLRFEIDEIEDAALKPGEEEELSRAYRRFMGQQKDCGGPVRRLCGSDRSGCG